MTEKTTSDDVIRGATSVSIVAAAVYFGPSMALGYYLWKNPGRVRIIGGAKLSMIGALCLVTAAGAWFLWLDRFPLYHWDALQEPVVSGVRWLRKFQWLMLGRMFVSGWWGGTGLVLLASPLLMLFRKPARCIRTLDFKVRVKDYRRIRRAFGDPKRTPIGIDIKTGEIVFLSESRRTSHVLVLGATGSGKTMLMVNLIMHAVRHGLPCLVIDPKGDNKTLRLIERIGRGLAPDFDARLKVFRMSKPAESCFYNPLKHGTAIQLKDRILEALNWSEQYYQSVAGDFLTLFTACVEKNGGGLTLEMVSRVMGEKREQTEIIKAIRSKLQPGDTKGEELCRRMNTLLERVKAEDLMGLQAQLSILNSPSIGPLLSFTGEKNEIDLREVLRSNQIAYFQLDTLGNPDTARRLGRMVVEDVKSLASEVYHSDESQLKFFPIFIDEFGSFASKEFIEVLKQIRGARFGAHLFTQGLEDLDVVSKEFRRQASSNPITKIGFRLDDNETVNEFCSMAGTVEATEQSYQVEGQLAPTKTGMGNLRETRQMLVEHDVLKNLETGRAVVIEKSPSQVLGVDVFHPDVLVR
jgi:hypothetical protein